MKSMSEISEIREQFPQLQELVYGKPLVYLDNAATSLRPVSVAHKWNEMSLKYNSNLHRAVHYMARKATDEYEATRVAVGSAIGAAAGKIVFTAGATASLNLVASCLSESYLKEGDEIIIAESEHHSNIVPWQMACRRTGAKIKVLPVDDRGYLRIQELESMITEGRTKLLCVAQVSNVLGIINPIKEIVNICRSKGCATVVDGAQGIVHCPVNVTDLGCDFYAFSGHKVYAAPGTGVLYMREEWAEKLPPYMGGGEMIDTVSWESSTYAPAPQKFEAGTQNISGTPTLAPALELRDRMKENPEIKEFMLQELRSRSGIRLFGDPLEAEDKIPLFSFVVEGAHHEDLALILDKLGVAVRSGQMCAEPLMNRFGVSGMLRASFAPYNTIEEAEYFIEALDRAIKMLS